MLREVTNGTAVLEGTQWRLEGDTRTDSARSGEGGLYCSLGQLFDSHDKQGSNLDAISGSSSWIAESAFDPSLLRSILRRLNPATKPMR
jgi:hypothetical protein